LEFGDCSYQPAFGCQEYKHLTNYYRPSRV